jgi:hypothetical protein
MAPFVMVMLNGMKVRVVEKNPGPFQLFDQGPMKRRGNANFPTGATLFGIEISPLARGNRHGRPNGAQQGPRAPPGIAVHHKGSPPRIHERNPRAIEQDRPDPNPLVNGVSVEDPPLGPHQRL